jgi:hypothetical protein
MVARVWPVGGAAVARAGHRGGWLRAWEATSCCRGALGSDSKVNPQPRWPVDGGGGAWQRSSAGGYCGWGKRVDGVWPGNSTWEIEGRRGRVGMKTTEGGGVVLVPAMAWTWWPVGRLPREAGEEWSCGPRLLWARPNWNMAVL